MSLSLELNARDIDQYTYTKEYTLMALTYCPNCRQPFTGSPREWICLAPKSEVPSQLDVGVSDDIVSYFHQPDASADEIPYQTDDKLCYAYNHADECIATGCTNRKADGLFQSACPNPKCRLELPILTGEISGHTFAVTGPSGAGKTSYLVAIEQWGTSHLRGYGLSMRAAMAERVKTGFNYLKQRILRHKQVAIATPKGYSISFSWIIKKLDGGKPGLLLSLPDASGEGLYNPHHLIGNRYYQHAKGIIILLDGERFLGIDGRDPEDHVNLVDAMVQDLNRLYPSEQERRRLPIAVCVNKSDVLTKSDPGWEQLCGEGRFIPAHQGRFDHATCKLRSDGLQQILSTCPGMGQVMSILDAEFDNVMYFVIATLGSSKTEDLSYMPVSVEDPFLFLLWHHEYVS